MAYVAHHIAAAWPRILGAARALERAGSFAGLYRGVLDQRGLVERAQLAGELVASAHIDAAVRCCAAFEDMEPGDWLRMAAIDATIPRRRPPPSVAIALRLRGVQCQRLVAQVVEDLNGEDAVLVELQSTRGDVVSCRREDFDEALEGALRMAGALPDRPQAPARQPLPDTHSFDDPRGGDTDE